MSDEEVGKNAEVNAGIERRSLLGAAAAVALGGTTEVSARQLPPPEFHMDAGAYSYVYEDYAGNYTSRWFVNKILSTAAELRSKFSRDQLKWGHYQKSIAGTDTSSGWGSNSSAAKFLFKNWESAVDDARKDLAKRKAPWVGPDPDNPTRRAANLLEHLDESIRFAIYDKIAPGQTKPGIPFDVQVNVQPTNNKRHTLSVTWHSSGMASPHNVDRLIIRMICPLGGWLGYATLQAPASAGRITKSIAKWKVPKAPRDEGQVIFIFNGLESVPSGNYTPGILQPVLQWTAADGWTIRSWYVPETYTPKPEQLPTSGCEKLPGQQPNGMCANVGFDPDNPTDNSANPYVTKALVVAEGDLLEGHAEWDAGSQSYSCWFVHTSASGGPASQVALLTVPGLPPLTYAAAVIEGYLLYNTQSNKFISMNGLPSPVQMDGVYLEYETTPTPAPNWDLGSEDPTTGSPVHYGTNRLRSYRATSPASGTFVFKAKQLNS
jgi:hypothetical protein